MVYFNVEAYLPETSLPKGKKQAQQQVEKKVLHGREALTNVSLI